MWNEDSRPGNLRSGNVAACVDLWATDSEAGLVTQPGKATAESLASTADRMLGAVQTFFGRLSPSVSVDPDGKPKVNFGFGEGTEPPEADDRHAPPLR